MAGGTGPSISASDRIEQLNNVDRDVAKLLQYAGTAIKALTSAAPESNGNQDDQAQNIEQRKADFSAASSEYFGTLSSIDVRLRRHITALEKAGILPSEMGAADLQSVQSDAKSSQLSTANNRTTITNGGLGNLDIGWLNSRSDHAEKPMEAELWEEAQRMVQRTLDNKIWVEDEEDATMSDDRAMSAA
ncbi:MAG: hypothetical protein LQ348_001342 [Seirophora lacunosa]|nr:MAG: hypothetical protein LQ348_001342 [Seirophora lacunosa]